MVRFCVHAVCVYFWLGGVVSKALTKTNQRRKMYTPLIFKKLAETTKSNDKKQIIQENANNPEFIELLDAALNPYRVFGFKTVSYTPSSDVFKKDLHKEFSNLLLFLESNPTNNEQRQIVTNFLNKCDIHSQQLYADIICKNLRVGVQASLVNKALNQNLIPDFKCMLASPMADDIEFQYPVIVQHKLDGVRCLVIKEDTSVKAFTREGKPLFLPNIFHEVGKIKGSFVLDGELLLQNNRLKTAGVVNKILRNTATSAEANALVFHVFDLLSFEAFTTMSCKTPLRGRVVALERTVPKSKVINIVPTFYADNYTTVINIYKEVRVVGEEGIIVKDRNGMYEFKRSKNWIKFKAVKSCTLSLVGCTKGTGKFEDSIGALICKSSCGNLTVSVGSGLTDEDRKFFETARTGTLIEVVYNELQEDLNGITFLFLPRFKEIRLDKTEADSLATIKAEGEEDFK
jgi:DNA ligase 1